MQEQIQQAIESAQRVVVIQADNPDADSLGSALALESIIGDLGKEVSLYCGVNIPEYLRYMSGWDRVVETLPSAFDCSIIVDASTLTLLDKLVSSDQLRQLKRKPCIVLDHHATVENQIDFTDLQIIDPAVASTGELIFHLSTSLGWAVSASTAEYIMSSILGDTQGLMNDLTTPNTYRVMADLAELGAARPKLEEARREFSKMPQKIYAYKGRLLGRTEFLSDGRVALLHIPQAEITEYSPLYNPAPLVQSDMLQVQGVQLAVVFKTYDDGRITAALRSNNGSPVCGSLAEELGGGGHAHAAGFKITDGRNYSEIKSQVVQLADQLLGGVTENIA